MCDDNWKTALLEAHNQQRQDTYGAGAVRWDNDLESLAQDQCAVMLESSIPSHGFLPDNGYQNVLQGKRNFIRKPAKVVEVWLTSDSGHRRPIVDPTITRIGASFAVNPTNNDVYICCNYAR